MMTLPDLKELVEKDVDKVFDILDEVFEDTSGAYNDLCDEYFDRPENFQMKSFRSKLKRFITRNISLIKSFDNKSEVVKETEALEENQSYDLLLNLDFKHQWDHFNSILKSTKRVIPFIIRGKNEFSGQKWLYHKLIYKFEKEYPINPTITYDLSENKFSLIELINELSRTFKVEDFKETDPLENKKSKLRRTVEQKIATASQFIVLKNAYHFIYSADYEEFIDILNYFFIEISTLKKCRLIFLFVESTENTYPEDHCFFTSCKKPKETRDCKEFKFIDLDLISPIEPDDIDNWEAFLPDDVRNKLKEKLNGEYNDFIQECNEGNPDILIPEICKKIDINYNEIEQKWLKY